MHQNSTRTHGAPPIPQVCFPDPRPQDTPYLFTGRGNSRLWRCSCSRQRCCSLWRTSRLSRWRLLYNMANTWKIHRFIIYIAFQTLSREFQLHNSCHYLSRLLGVSTDTNLLFNVKQKLLWLKLILGGDFCAKEYNSLNQGSNLRPLEWRSHTFKTELSHQPEQTFQSFFKMIYELLRQILSIYFDWHV